MAENSLTCILNKLNYWELPPERQEEIRRKLQYIMDNWDRLKKMSLKACRWEIQEYVRKLSKPGSSNKQFAESRGAYL